MPQCSEHQHLATGWGVLPWPLQALLLVTHEAEAHLDNFNIGAKVGIQGPIALHGPHDVLGLAQCMLKPLQALLSGRPISLWGASPPCQLLLQVICFISA